MYDRLQRLVEGIRPKAVSLAIEQAEILLQAVTEANGRLAADGHEFRSKVDLKRRRQAGIEGAPPDVPDLLAESQKAINERPRSDGATGLRRGMGSSTPVAAHRCAS